MTQPNMPPPSDPTAGFYPDSQGVVRLWDGQRWTEVTRPMPQPATSAAGQPGYYPDSQGGTRWWDGRQWTPTVMPPQPAHQQPPPKRHWPSSKGKLLVVILILLACLVAFVSCVGGLASMDSTDSDTTTAATDTGDDEPAPNANAAKPKKAKPAADTVEDGDYLVGREIKTGTWKTSKVPDEGAGLCYADTQTKKGDILEQELGNAGDSVIIRIKSNAYTFSSSGCGIWHRVD